MQLTQLKIINRKKKEDNQINHKNRSNHYNKKIWMKNKQVKFKEQKNLCEI